MAGFLRTVVGFNNNFSSASTSSKSVHGLPATVLQRGAEGSSGLVPDVPEAGHFRSRLLLSCSLLAPRLLLSRLTEQLRGWLELRKLLSFMMQVQGFRLLQRSDEFIPVTKCGQMACLCIACYQLLQIRFFLHLCSIVLSILHVAFLEHLFQIAVRKCARLSSGSFVPINSGFSVDTS